MKISPTGKILQLLLMEKKIQVLRWYSRQNESNCEDTGFKGIEKSKVKKQERKWLTEKERHKTRKGKEGSHQ